MRRLFPAYAVVLVALGALTAIACLACSWYINRLQADLARTVRQDSVGMLAAVDLQVQLRHLRVHALVLVADRTDERWKVVKADLATVDAALAAVRQSAVAPEDETLAARIEHDYLRYKSDLHLEQLPEPSAKMNELALWSDKHHMAELIEVCRQLADGQRNRMEQNLERSEAQTAWAGRILLALGLGGVLAGLMSGYVTARALTSRMAKLFVRVQAVQAHLDQDVGAMTVQRGSDLADLDQQLDRVVQRVSAVCQRLHEQERELLRAEQLAAVGQLAAGVAHEIRNPLTGVKLLLQGAVRPQEPTPLTTDRLQLILQEIGRIERTVQELMNLAVAPPLERQPHEIGDIVGMAVQIAQGRADTKSIFLRLAPAGTGLVGSVDHDRFLSVLTNLLFNAIEATPVGGTVELSVARDGSGMIQVSVADSGPGISESLASKLFTPFATTKPTGTGLGLSIARRIAQDHGGSLNAAPRPEGGTCFTLVIPALEQSSHGETSGR